MFTKYCEISFPPRELGLKVDYLSLQMKIRVQLYAITVHFIFPSDTMPTSLQIC